MSEPIDFGRPLIVNKTGRDTCGLGRREPDDEHRLVARYQAPVEMRLAERRRVERSDEEEDETEASMSAAETDSDQAPRRPTTTSKTD